MESSEHGEKIPTTASHARCVAGVGQVPMDHRAQLTHKDGHSCRGVSLRKEALVICFLSRLLKPILSTAGPIVLKS